MTHEHDVQNEELSEGGAHRSHHSSSSRQGGINLTLSAKSIFWGGFVLGVLLMAIPTTFFASRTLSGTVVGNQPSNGAAPSAPSAPSAPNNEVARPAGQVKPVSKDDHVRGDAKAPLSLIVYTDYECPFCKRFHPEVKKLLDEYKGKVKWVYRHFPLSFHANAQKEAEATECAAEIGGNDKFWEYTDKIFDRTTSNGTGIALDQLVPLAKEIGLDEKKFKDCLDNGKMAAKVQKDFSEGQTAGVDGTPGNIFLGKDGKSVFVPGAVPYETLKSQVDQMLTKK